MPYGDKIEDYVGFIIRRNEHNELLGVDPGAFTEAKRKSIAKESQYMTLDALQIAFGPAKHARHAREKYRRAYGHELRMSRKQAQQEFDCKK